MRNSGGGWVLFLLAGAALAGCGGSVGGAGGSGGETTGTSGGTGGTGSGTGGTGPTVVTGGAGGAVPGVEQTLAVHKVRLGDQLADGTTSSTAWQHFGFNLDGLVSTKDSVDVCKPAAGAKASSVYPDGVGGIDNGFGKNILPIFTSLAADLAASTNDAIADGRFSVLLRIQGIAPGQTGTFATQLFTGQFPDGQSPAWLGTDAWPIRDDCLVNGDLATPITQFPSSTVKAVASGERRWESVSAGDVRLELSGSLLPVVLPIHQARITMMLSNDNTHATVGMIGGILNTEEFISEFAKMAGNFDPSLCPPSTTMESIALQFRQASDIMADGSQNPNATCDGISIGLGFDADGALLGGVFSLVPQPDPCNM